MSGKSDAPPSEVNSTVDTSKEGPTLTPGGRKVWDNFISLKKLYDGINLIDRGLSEAAGDGDSYSVEKQMVFTEAFRGAVLDTVSVVTKDFTEGDPSTKTRRTLVMIPDQLLANEDAQGFLQDAVEEASRQHLTTLSVNLFKKQGHIPWMSSMAHGVVSVLCTKLLERWDTMKELEDSLTGHTLHDDFNKALRPAYILLGQPSYRYDPKNPIVPMETSSSEADKGLHDKADLETWHSEVRIPLQTIERVQDIAQTQSVIVTKLVQALSSSGKSMGPVDVPVRFRYTPQAWKRKTDIWKQVGAEWTKMSRKMEEKTEPPAGAVEALNQAALRTEDHLEDSLFPYLYSAALSKAAEKKVSGFSATEFDSPTAVPFRTLPSNEHKTPKQFYALNKNISYVLYKSNVKLESLVTERVIKHLARTQESARRAESSRPPAPTGA